MAKPEFGIDSKLTPQMPSVKMLVEADPFDIAKRSGGSIILRDNLPYDIQYSDGTRLIWAGGNFTHVFEEALDKPLPGGSKATAFTPALEYKSGGHHVGDDAVSLKRNEIAIISGWSPDGRVQGYGLSRRGLKKIDLDEQSASRDLLLAREYSRLYAAVVHQAILKLISGF